MFAHKIKGTENINGVEYIKDAQGRLMPVSTVRAEDLLEHDLVFGLCHDAVKLNKELDAFRSISLGEADTLLQLLSERYGLKKGGKKGNLTLLSLCGQFKVQISMNDFLVFGAELEVAKALIDECIKDWGTGQNDRIIALVNHAFRVDKAGRVNKDDILSLRKIDIKDEKWLLAMDAISKSIRVSRTKRYIRFYKRPSPDRDFEAITLDIAKVQ